MRDPLIEEDEKGYLRFRDSRKLVHRWVMEKHLNRRLERGEIVHHKDGNRQNNDLENLQLLTAKEHYKIHVVPRLQERIEAGIKEKLIPQLQAETAKAITIGFAAAGAVLFIAGLITKGKLDLWYLGLAFLIAALLAWYFVWRKNES